MTGTEVLEDTVETRWRRLSPLTVWADGAVIAALTGLAAVVAAVVLTLVGMFVPWGLLAVLASMLLAGVLVGSEVLRYRHTRYQVTGERLEVRSGVLARAHLSLSRDRIRSVDLATPLWTRPFGLCKVTVGTGQKVGSGDEITLTYVETAEGDRLRRDLLHQTTAGPDAAPGDETADETATRVLATMAPVWFGYGVAAPGPAALAYSGIAAVAGALSEFGIRWIADTYLDAGAAPSAGFVVTWTLLALAGAVALASLGALALHVEAWWNYRLTREPNGTLRVRRGLLNLSSVSIEERRLRGVELREYLPLRWFGAASVAAVASGLDSEEGGGQKSLVPKRSLSPEVPRARAERIAAASLPGAVLGPLTAHPGAALRRRLLRAAAAVAGLTVLATALTLVSSAEPVARTPVPTIPLWVAAAVLVVSAPIAGLYAWGCYRGLGHGLTERHLAMRRGMAARSTAVLKREAVIGWTVRRSFFQRRAGLATIGATIAADKGVFHAADTDSSEGLAFAEEAVPGLLAPFLERG
ncbi:putative membrane protein [Lipingzhangella halophila]|uniref:Putative membrane protein n=1 Tax=Lipingzhangella halophila TaxID=1783352 RepID=A0A7W7W626_9ACTN|nr:PH domain-containing protein [Lipingzhangella halophila]MBB4935353.1 putative membrane protein [Lipingzhangella halophila]